MKRNEFEKKYLNKMVEVVLFDNDIFKGYLYSTNDYMNKTKLLDVKNHYFVGNNIRDNGVRFRKSHIKKMKLEVGQFIRTNDGYINKIEKVNQFNVLVVGRDLFGEKLNIPNNEITKASYNIIDILEVGDYVNVEILAKAI